MVFNRKGNFFLNLDEKAPEKPATVAPVTAPKAADAKPAASTPEASIAIAPAPASTGAAAATATTAGGSAGGPAAEPASGPVLTTAEAIAAELAAAQAARPAVSNATFAPECLVPGTALPMRRRRGGANLAGFRGMAGGLFGKK
jgi:hypothetical protein